MNKNINKNNWKLFDELWVSEKYLGKTIEHYIFTEEKYKLEIENKLNAQWDYANHQNNSKLILDRSDKINFRYKGIIFLGVSKKDSDIFYFYLTTTKDRDKNEYPNYVPIYSKTITKNISAKEIRTIFVNLDRIYFFNINEITVKKGFNNKKKYINFFSSDYLGEPILMKIKNHDLKKLYENTDEIIYADYLNKKRETF